MRIEPFQPLDRLKPDFYDNVTEMEQLLITEDKLYEEAVGIFNTAQDGQFIQTMSLPFIKGMEGLLGITALSSETLEFRRSRILNRLNTRPPFNLQFLKDKLDNIYGEGNYTLSIGNQDVSGRPALTRYSPNENGNPMTVEPDENTTHVGRMYLGDTSKAIKGWKMANGEFLRVYPNPNLLPDSEEPQIQPYLGAEFTRSVVSVAAWGATNAQRVRVALGTGTSEIFGTLRANRLVDAGVNYAHSIYIWNRGSTTIRVSNNLGITLAIEPGRMLRLLMPARNSANGTASMQFVFYRSSINTITDVVVWHAKIEEAPYDATATPWVPRIVDDYHNAVPLYAGSTDKSPNVESDFDLGINTARDDFNSLALDPKYYDWNLLSGEYTITLESASLNRDWFREGYITIMSIKPANLEYIHRPLLFDNVIATEGLEKALGERFRVGVSRIGIDPLLKAGEYQEVDLHDPN